MADRAAGRPGPGDLDGGSRVISTVDPEARHAHKTVHRRQGGFKAHIAVEPDTGLVTECAVTRAQAGPPYRLVRRARGPSSRHPGQAQRENPFEVDRGSTVVPPVVRRSRTGQPRHNAPKVTRPARRDRPRESVRAGHGAGLVIDGEVVQGEPARHRRPQRERLDERNMPGLGPVRPGPRPIRTPKSASTCSVVVSAATRVVPTSASPLPGPLAESAA